MLNGLGLGTMRGGARHAAPRILFFGSDMFALPSLIRLKGLEQRHPESLALVDVMCKRDRWTGRGNKILSQGRRVWTKSVDLTRAVPVKKWCGEQGVKVYEFDDEIPFDAQMPPHKYDVAVAVSFGHLIPARVLSQFTHGGLNIHPSLLPRYRGPAPLHWTLLNGDKEAGVSLQTLHPTKFDEGMVIAQEAIALSPHATLAELQDQLAQRGADMLARAIVDRAYEHPAPAPPALGSECAPSHARKLNKADMATTFADGAHVYAQSRVFGQVTALLDHKHPVKLRGISVVDDASVDEGLQAQCFALRDRDMVVRCRDGKVLRVDQVSYRGKWLPGPEFAKVYNYGRGGSLAG